MSMPLAYQLEQAESPLEVMKIVRDWLEEKGERDAAALLHDETFMPSAHNAAFVREEELEEEYEKGFEEGRKEGAAESDDLAYERGYADGKRAHEAASVA